MMERIRGAVLLWLMVRWNRLGLTGWRFARVTRAWADELEKGKGGVGAIILVWHQSFFYPNWTPEPVWLLHPRSHFRMVVLTGADPKDRWPMYLNQAIELL